MDNRLRDPKTDPRKLFYDELYRAPEDRIGLPLNVMLKLKGCTIEHTDDMLAIAEITNATHEATLYPKYRPSLLLDMLVPIAGSQDMQANLEELFPVWIERHGVQRARWIQRAQVAQLIGGNWWENILSSAERLLKIVKLIGF